MVKALIGLLIAAIAAAFIRGVIALISREVGQMVNPTEAKAGPGPQQAPDATALRKCPVCGTYSPGDRMINGQYCSQPCALKAAS